MFLRNLLANIPNISLMLMIYYKLSAHWRHSTTVLNCWKRGTLDSVEL